MNALAKKKVGEYLNDHFVSSHQKVGTFEKIGNEKVGGNVASYFCRPDGTVLHAIAGPVDQATFLAEARFAVELHNAASFQAFAVKTLDSPREQAIYTAAVKKGFADRLGPGNLKRKGPIPNGTLQERVNTLLYQAPLPPLELLYPNVWENVLNEKLSAAPISVR